MHSKRMICCYCKDEIPPDSFILKRFGYDEEIECPNCKVLNNIYLANGRGMFNPMQVNYNTRKMVKK